MAYELFTRVALKVDAPAHRLRRGDAATVVEPIRVARTRNRAIRPKGETITVVTVRESQIEALTRHEVLHVRPFDGLRD